MSKPPAESFSSPLAESSSRQRNFSPWSTEHLINHTKLSQPYHHLDDNDDESEGADNESCGKNDKRNHLWTENLLLFLLLLSSAHHLKWSA